MELHQLEYFLAVHRYSSFSTAALEINISQSTVSQQIKKLEDSLGVRLFIRDARSVRLSPAGEAFLHYAQRIIAEIKRSREAMLEYSNHSQDHIRVGANPTIGYLGLNKIIADFLKAHPKITLEIHEGTSDELLRWLGENKLNVAFVTAPFVEGRSVDFYPLVNDEIAALLPGNHELANNATIDLSQLSREEFLMVKSSAGFRNTLLQACNQSGFNPHVLFDGSHEILRSFVEEGAGVVLMGHRIAQCLTNPQTAVVSLRQHVRRVNGLAVSRDRSATTVTRLFRDFALAHMSIFG